MRWALLGNHPDGVALAEALVASGRHSLLVHTTGLGEDVLARLGNPPLVADVEEILADPAIDAVLVAGSPGVRPEQLRRALQSERHVICCHPADARPDVAYEAAMLQGDTRKTLVPILPEGLHPAIGRFAELVDRDGSRSPVGAFRLLVFERHSEGEVLEDASTDLAVPGWDVLRRLGGELGEVSTFADAEMLEPGMPVLLAGRFVKGGLFQVMLVPRQPASRWRLVLIGTRGQAELLLPLGWAGPSVLRCSSSTGSTEEEHWPAWSCWPTLVEIVEQALRGEPATVTWQDEVRALELDDAARRSVERRRVNQMEYQEASEEVGFKGTMALTGCGLLWTALLLLVVSVWFPWVGWLILPMLVVFIGLQLLRYAVPRRPDESSEGGTNRDYRGGRPDRNAVTK